MKSSESESNPFKGVPKAKFPAKPYGNNGLAVQIEVAFLN